MRGLRVTLQLHIHHILMAGWYLPRLISYRNLITTILQLDPINVKKEVAKIVPNQGIDQVSQ